MKLNGAIFEYELVRFGLGFESETCKCLCSIEDLRFGYAGLVSGTKCLKCNYVCS